MRTENEFLSQIVEILQKDCGCEIAFSDIRIDSPLLDMEALKSPRPGLFRLRIPEFLIRVEETFGVAFSENDDLSSILASFASLRSFIEDRETNPEERERRRVSSLNPKAQA